MPDRLTTLLEERPWLLIDGATGTNLFAMGLETGEAPELWNQEQPEKILALHQGFVDAGSDIILTNSFGGTRNRLKLHQAEGRVAEISRAAAQLARKVADQSGRDVVVAGSMGPTGDIFQPIGELSYEEGAAAFAEQAQALAEGGADVLWIETISAVEELDAALEGAATTGLPVVTTLSFDTNGRTMMGVTPADVARRLSARPQPPLGFGGNCGVGAAELIAAIVNMTEATAPETVLVAKSNCGIPEFVDGKICYNGTPSLMADYARLARDAGARLIGGCCGTTPEHLVAMRESLQDYEPGALPSMEAIVARLGQISTGAMSQSSGGPLGDAPRRDRGARRRRGRRQGAGDRGPRF